MTDNEIIKALECRILTGLRKINKCGKCKYVKSDACNIRGLITDALDLINRQNEQLQANSDSRQTNECENIDVVRFEAEINSLQAEIERLQTEKDNLIKTFAECQKDVIKEFAERLNDRIVNFPSVYPIESATLDFLNGSSHRQLEILEIIDNLVKEMVGEE